MPKLDIEFAWPVALAGYAINKIAHPDKSGSGLFLVAQGDEMRWRNPLAENPVLFRRFALLPDTAAACIEFANEYGLLFGVDYREIEPVDRARLEDPSRPAFFEFDRDSIDEWSRQIRRLQRLVERWDRARAAGESTAPYWEDLRRPQLTVDLVLRSGRPGICLQPDCLLSGIDLQFYQAVAGMTELRACEQCGDWFECGPGGGRRTVSRFCSDRCRFNFHNERRSKGASQ
jgi:hypothetical protein